MRISDWSSDVCSSDLQARGYVTAGGFSGRVDVHHDYLTSVTLPKVRAGCGGIDMFLGGMSFLDPDYLVQKLESILQAAPAVAFQYLLERSEERRVGKEGGSTCRSRWSPIH